MPTDSDFTMYKYFLHVHFWTFPCLVKLTTHTGQYPPTGLVPRYNSQVTGNNIFTAPDFRNPVWKHPTDQLRCVSVST